MFVLASALAWIVVNSSPIGNVNLIFGIEDVHVDPDNAVDLRISDRRFVCDTSDVDNTSMAEAESLKRQIADAKASWLMHSCYPAETTKYKYDLCPGLTLSRTPKEVDSPTSFRSNTMIARHDKSKNLLFANGTLVHFYEGIGGWSTKVRYQCGDLRLRVSTSGAVDMLAPQFCDWRPSMKNPPVGTLLKPLVGWCGSYEPGPWSSVDPHWMYRFCFPGEALQYHHDPDHPQATQQHRLGKLPRANRFKVDVVDRLNVYLEDRSIVLDLPLGDWCEPIKRPRSAVVKFVCPLTPVRELAVIRSAYERELCVYEFIVETALVCAHPTLMRPRISPESIPCFEVREEAEVFRPESWNLMEG